MNMQKDAMSEAAKEVPDEIMKTIVELILDPKNTSKTIYSLLLDEIQRLVFEIEQRTNYLNLLKKTNTFIAENQAVEEVIDALRVLRRRVAAD